jgi:hypothetical protein
MIICPLGARGIYKDTHSNPSLFLSGTQSTSTTEALWYMLTIRQYKECVESELNPSY